MRTFFNVPSRSIFFLRRRRALSTGSPFLSLISVNPIHFLSGRDSRRLAGCSKIRTESLDLLQVRVNLQKIEERLSGSGDCLFRCLIQNSAWVRPQSVGLGVEPRQIPHG